MIPFSSLLSLLVTVLCLAGSILILKNSHQHPIDTWPTQKYPVQPSVLLSICTALANLAIRTMFDAGVVISWWRKAKSGSTVGELHRSWNYGTGMLSVLQGGFHFNRVALASILVGIVAIDGPLLQRASRVTTTSYLETKQIQVGLFADLDMVGHPTGYSTGRAGNVDLLAEGFLPVVRGFEAREPIALTYSGCNGTCTTEIVGPGFDVQCILSTKELVFNMSTMGATNKVLDFSFGFNRRLDTGLITLNISLPITPKESTIRECNLRLSQVRYQVQLNNGTVQLLPASPALNNTVKIQQPGIEAGGGSFFASTIGGIWLSAEEKWASTGSLYVSGAPFQLLSDGDTVLTYLNTYKDGNWTWHDPTDVFIANMRELLFRTAIVASSSNSSNPLSQTVSAIEESERAVYDSRYEYLAAAFAVMLAAMLATSSNLFGWWQLDRAHTVGPLEIAKAFNAPFLNEAGYLGTSEKGFKVIEKKGIQYGELVGDFGSTNVVKGTSEYRGFGQDIELLGGQGEQRPVKIGMGSPGLVQNLR